MSVSVSFSVFLFVCLPVRSYITEISSYPNFAKILLRVICRSSSRVGIRYLLPVLWMTSCLPTKQSKSDERKASTSSDFRGFNLTHRGQHQTEGGV